MYDIVGSGVNPANHGAKGAMGRLTKITAVGWAQEGVRVNSVHHASIDTPILGDADRDMQRPASRNCGCVGSFPA